MTFAALVFALVAYLTVIGFLWSGDPWWLALSCFSLIKLWLAFCRVCCAFFHRRVVSWIGHLPPGLLVEFSPPLLCSGNRRRF